MSCWSDSTRNPIRKESYDSKLCILSIEKKGFQPSSLLPGWQAVTNDGCLWLAIPQTDSSALSTFDWQEAVLMRYRGIPVHRKTFTTVINLITVGPYSIMFLINATFYNIPMLLLHLDLTNNSYLLYNYYLFTTAFDTLKIQFVFSRFQKKCNARADTAAPDFVLKRMNHHKIIGLNVFYQDIILHN